MAEKSKLDIAANVAILVVCVIAAFILIRNNFFPPRPPGAPPEAEVGEQLDALKAVVPAGAERALVLAVSPACHFCTESMPFYKRLTDQRDSGGSKVKVIAAVPAAAVQAEETSKLAQAGVKPDAVVVVEFDKVKVAGTPTILLVDNQGKVLNIWVGKQPAKGEQEILAAL